MIPKPPVVDGQYLEVSPGIRLHYASCGEKGKPLMLFVHGFPEFWGAWRGIMPAFADRYFAVAPDLRGYNLSSKPAELAAYRPKTLVGDLAGMIHGLGYDKAVLVAHDWGGALGWALAIGHPELVDRLVILNATHPVPFARALVNDPEQRAASQYMTWLRTPGCEQEFMADDFRRLEEFFHKVSEAAWFPQVRDEYRTAWAQPGALTAAINYYRASPLHPPTDGEQGAAKLQLREEDFMVRVPTLVIWGERDAALRPVLLEGLDRMVPDLRVERLPQATHWLVHEEPERIVAWMRDFLGI